MRLRRSDPNRPGYTRRRRGNGFSYHDRSGDVITDPAELERVRSLVIPPAWRDVWICPDPRGHIQAVGTDAAGRRQYRYHDVWRAQRDAAKFDHVLEVGAALPKVRQVVAEHLRERGLSRDRVLAAAVRLLDVGCFRIGGEEYATGDEATFGLATLRREHVALVRGAVRFCYPAKGGVQRTLDVRDDEVRAVVRGLLRHDPEQAELLAYRDGSGWCDVRSADVNGYLREVSGMEISAKDFRTWNGTVLAAVVLAADELEAAARTASRSASARKRAVSRAMREVSEYLGNTPAVARASYVDPRVVDLFCDGTTIAPVLADLGGAPGPEDSQAQHTVEAAVLELLRTSTVMAQGTENRTGGSRAAGRNRPGNDTPDTPNINESELARMKVDELRRFARENGVERTSAMRKQELLRAVTKQLKKGGAATGRRGDGPKKSTGGARRGGSSSKSLKYAQEITSTDAEPERPGRTLVTTDHDVIRQWAEERRAVPATVEGSEHEGRPGVLRFDFPGGDDGGRLVRIGWDAWFDTFDTRGLNFLYQEERTDGRQSNFFRLENPNREDA